MSTIGLIGSGNIGGTVARLAVAAGHEVVLSNRRGPDTLTDLVEELGPAARAAAPAEAAAAGDFVVVAVPLVAYTALPAEELRGRTVIDTGNYYPGRDGRIPELEEEATTTSELLQAHLPHSRVVKAFGNIYFEHLGNLARPHGHPERSALPIAGDDAGAKRDVTGLLDSLGYDAVDAGPLAEGWRFQRDTAAYTPLYVGEGWDVPGPDKEFDAGPGSPAPAREVRQALARARRYRDMEGRAWTGRG